MRDSRSLKRNILNTTPVTNPWVFPIRKNSGDPQQPPEIQPNKAYRLIYQCFNHNIYKFIKKHKNCLGDIEETYKPKVPKQEEILLEENKEKLFAKYYEKLKREMTYRNNLTQRNINSYQSSYKEIFRMGQTLELQNSKTQLMQKSDIVQIKQFSPRKMPNRPFSSTVNRSKPIMTLQMGFNRSTRGTRQPDIYRSANIQNGQSQSYGRNYTYRNQQFKRINKVKVLECEERQMRPQSFFLQEEQIYIFQRRNQSGNYQSQKVVAEQSSLLQTSIRDLRGSKMSNSAVKNCCNRDKSSRLRTKFSWSTQLWP